MTGGGVLQAGAGLLGGFLTQEGQENTNVANAEQASRQMDFQERMSNTAYQRAVKDMQAAGLNPMLAYSQGGAGTPSGAMATMQNALGAGVASAQMGSKVGPEVQHLKAQAGLLEAQTENQAAQGDLYRAQADKLRTGMLVDYSLVPKYEQETRTGVSSAGQLDAMAAKLRELLPYEKNLLEEQRGETRARGFSHAAHAAERTRYTEGGGPEADIAEMLARAKLYGVESALKGFHIPAARNQARVDESEYGRNVRPYLGDLGKGASSASDIFRMLPQGRTFYRGRN